MQSCHTGSWNGSNRTFLQIKELLRRHEVGNLWQRNRITVVQEHLASAISQNVLVGAYLKASFLAPIGQSAVFACVEGNHHGPDVPRLVIPRVAGDGTTLSPPPRTPQQPVIHLTPPKTGHKSSRARIGRRNRHPTTRLTDQLHRSFANQTGDEEHANRN